MHLEHEYPAFGNIVSFVGFSLLAFTIQSIKYPGYTFICLGARIYGRANRELLPADLHISYLSKGLISPNTILYTTIPSYWDELDIWNVSVLHTHHEYKLLQHLTFKIILRKCVLNCSFLRWEKESLIRKRVCATTITKRNKKCHSCFYHFPPIFWISWHLLQNQNANNFSIYQHVCNTSLYSLSVLMLMIPCLCLPPSRKKGREEMFYLTTQSTHCICGYMVYYFRLAASVVLYALSLRQHSFVFHLGWYCRGSYS